MPSESTAQLTIKQNPRTVLYARVSSEEQREKQSIQTQISYAEEYCEKQGLTLQKIYQDQAVSGTVDFEKRPAGRSLLQDARTGKIDCVLLYKVDRLGRNTRLTLAAAHLLEVLGIMLKSMTEPFDTTTPAGRFMFSMFASAAELERNQIRERITDGRDRQAKAGKWIGGYTPRGYRLNEQRELEIDNTMTTAGITEEELVRNIFHWMADEHLSTREIAKKLNNMGIPTARAKNGHSLHLYTLLWQPGSVVQIIKNPIYKGEHIYRRVQNRSGRETSTYPVPALITPELWQKAQDTLRANIVHSKRNSKHREFLLRGVIRCGRCGLGMYGLTMNQTRRTKTKGIQHYSNSSYRCLGIQPEKQWSKGKCLTRYVKAQWLEDIIWEEISAWILNRTTLEGAINKALSSSMGDHEHLKKSITVVLKQLQSLDQERQAVIKQFRKSQITEEDLQEQLADIAKEKHVLEETAQGLEQKIQNTTDPDAALRHVRNHMKKFQQGVRKGNLPFAQKRKIIKSLVSEIAVYTKNRKEWGRKEPAHMTRQTVPSRQDLAEEPKEAATETVWNRSYIVIDDYQEHEKIKITYNFPFPPGEQDIVVFAKGKQDSPEEKISSVIASSPLD